MNPKYVANLELSRRLKELGYPQKGEFWWVNSSQDEGYEGEIYWLCDKKWTLCSFLPQDGGEVPLSILKPGEAKSRYDDDAYAKEKELIKGIEYCHAPLAAEIKEKMPAFYPTVAASEDSEQIMLYWRGEDGLWYVGFYKEQKFVLPIIWSKIEVDTCAVAMIYFLEKKMISF